MSYPKTVVVVDILADVVSKTNAAILTTLRAYDPTIEQINYQYGPPLEIYETLATMSNADQAKKYPLIAVFQPFLQTKGAIAGIDSEVNLRIIIARWRNVTNKAAQSYDTNFRPVLYPVYAEFINQLATHKAIANATWETMKHDYKDWPYWDNDGKNPLVDCVDIVELSNLKLNFRSKNC